jgi:hypothetical protein
MRSFFIMAAVGALLAGCGDRAKEAADRADRAMAVVAELQQKVADLETEVADLDDQVDELNDDGPTVGSDDSDHAPRYAAARSPDRAFWMRARVRSTPKMATKLPKRGPVGCPSSTS